MRLVFLDTGPLGVLTNPKGTPDALACQQWVRDLLAAKVRVVVPAIADYELRRECPSDNWRKAMFSGVGG